jgi:aminoglycoside N3'-acetyltransferase
MPIPIIAKADFYTHLEALGIKRGDRICVHSRLLSFGRIEGAATTVRDALLDVVGKAGAVAVPTFTFNLTSEDVYDPALTPPYLCGPLSNCVRGHPLAKRTLCPVHSYAVIGASADALMAADPTRPLGPGSVFEVMRQEGFKLVLLGCTYNEGATYVHHVEADIGVKYRKLITFPRRVRYPNGDIETMIIHYHAKANKPSVTDNFLAVEQAIETAGEGIFVPLAQSKRRSHSIELSTLERRLKTMIDDDPYALVMLDPTKT